MFHDAPAEPENLRLWDFPIGVNRVYTPRAQEPISFAELRALAEAHDITRLAIETRKDQLEKLDARNRIRARNVQWLIESLRNVPGLRPFANTCQDTIPAYYKLGFQYDAERFGLSREGFIRFLQAEGISFDKGFQALHVGRSPSRFRPGDALAEASRADKGVVVLHHPVLLCGLEGVEQVSRAVHKIYTKRPSRGSLPV